MYRTTVQRQALRRSYFDRVSETVSGELQGCLKARFLPLGDFLFQPSLSCTGVAFEIWKSLFCLAILGEWNISFVGVK